MMVESGVEMVVSGAEMVVWTVVEMAARDQKGANSMRASAKEC
jgi:hypothetical protein